jgi:hypothetical protein
MQTRRPPSPGKPGPVNNLSIHPHANARAVAVTRALIPSAQVLGLRVGDTGRSFSRCAPRWCFVPVRTRRVYDAVLVSSSPASPPPHYAPFSPRFHLCPREVRPPYRTLCPTRFSRSHTTPARWLPQEKRSTLLGANMETRSADRRAQKNTLQGYSSHLLPPRCWLVTLVA